MMREKNLDSICGCFSEKWNRLIDRVYNLFACAEEKIAAGNRLNIAIIAALCAVSFALMYFLNINTPLIADDFSYAFIFENNGSIFNEAIGEERVTCVGDIVTSMRAHYYVMNGRVLLHFLVQLFLLIGKPVFNILNSVVYVAVMLLMYKHCIGREEKCHSAVLFLAICLSVWTFAPAWGMTTLWLTGSINYLWGTAIRLAALLPFRLYADNGEDRHPALKAVCMFAACALAGATNENTGAAFIGMTALFMIYYRVKKFKVPVWSFSGITGALLGFAFMCLAPGNFLRNENWNGNSLMQRITNIPANAILSFSVFVCVFIIMSFLLYNYNKDKKNYKIGIGFIYMLGAFGGAAVMLAVSAFPERAWFGLKIAAVIAVGNLIYQMNLTPKTFRQILLIGVIFWSVWASMSYIHAAQDGMRVMNENNSREEYIEEQKALGNYDLFLENIDSEDKHSPMYKMPDLNGSPDGWRNTSKSQYYGINSITRAD